MKKKLINKKIKKMFVKLDKLVKFDLKKSEYLPQILRFFPARYVVLGLKTVFWAFVFGILAYNFLPFLFSETWRLPILYRDSFESHLKLAEEFLTNNRLEEAEREYKIAKSKIPPAPTRLADGQGLRRAGKNQKSKIFEEIDDKIKFVAETKEKSFKLESEVGYWEGVLRERPNYRDAYLELAMLHYQLRRPITARDYLEQAIELDPNFKITKELGKMLQK